MNALTVDVEDWHALLYRDITGAALLPPSEHVITGTRILLELLAERGTLGTFFVSGPCAQAFPELVRQIAGAGHEVACHGWLHRPTWAFSRESFRQDLRRTVAALEDVLGAKVFGFRAPYFSIGPGETWALDVIAEEGLMYDSSLSPIRFAAEGRLVSPGLQRAGQSSSASCLVELPMTTLRWLGKQRNISGGRWFRALPRHVVLNGFRRLNEHGITAQTYIHTYEVLPYRLIVPEPLSGLAIRAKARLIELAYAARRGQTVPRLTELLSRCGPWLPIKDLAARFLTRSSGGAQ